MLIGNQSVLFKSPDKRLSGTSGAHVAGVGLGGGAVYAAQVKPSDWRKWSLRDQSGAAFQAQNRTYGKPQGYYTPGSYALPDKSGGMSIGWRGNGTLTPLTTRLIPAKLATIDLTGLGDLDATAQLVISMLLALTGSGDIDFDLRALLNASINLTGTGDLDADATGYAALQAALSGAGDLDAIVAAYGNMEIDIVVTGTGLTTANVGQAVWAALAASNNDPGTMGEKLNDAGSASNPWTEVLEAGLTAGDFMRLFMSVLAGNAEFNEDGSVTYKALDGTTTRISATTIAGIRTIISRNGA